jgi:CDGSH-type Zn-finger protein
MDEKQKCGCGRSLSGFCDGSHALTNEQYLNKLEEAKHKTLNENKQQFLTEGN